MEKAETMMMKMGWSQGQGLGKNEDGVASAVKLNSQMSREGLGYSRVDNDAWWVRIYDEAAKNVTSYTPAEVEDTRNEEEMLKTRKRKTPNERNGSTSDVRKNKKQKKTKKNKKYSEQTS